MSVRKFATEFSVNMVGLCVLVLQQDDFGMLENPAVRERLEEDPCHIYMIGRRPRIIFDPDVFKISNDTISGCFLVQRGMQFDRYVFEAENLVDQDDLLLECPFPHDVLFLRGPNGDLLHRSKASLIAKYIGATDLREQLHLEVLYIGQAFGADGSRTAPDRLQSHSTLQAIYAKAMSRFPDQEIWISLWNFQPLLISSIDGRWNQYETSLEEDDAHIDQVFGTPLSEQQEINFTEAGLIKYFQPEFNKVYKDVFPSPAHSTYSQCYDLDLNSLTIEVDTEDFGAMFWSLHAPAEWHHLISFQFHSESERRSMFDVLIPDEYRKA